MTQIAFGSGILVVTPTIDAFGNAIALPTPIKLGILQEASVDVSFDTKELYGSRSFAVDIARGKGKIAVKAKSAIIRARQMDALMFGQGVTVGQTQIFDPPVATPLVATVTVTPPNTGTFLGDRGVEAGGNLFTRVAASPTAGQYSVTTAGVYTFATADVGTPAYIRYAYSTATGNTLDISNLEMGEIPTFKAELQLQKAGKKTYVMIPNCVCSKLSLASKQDDYTIPDFDMSGFADSNGRSFFMSTLE